MRKTFKGMVCDDLDAFFGEEMAEEKALFAAAVHRDSPYRLVVGQGYRCCEYKKDINIFSFGKATLKLPFTVIAPPASIDREGCFGELEALAKDYSNRKGLFLVLNLRRKPGGPGVFAHTLAAAVFRNRFSSYEEYKASLRSHYRRRLSLAEKKGAMLRWKQVPQSTFDNDLHRLYLQVLRHSEFPLETLGMDFFRTCPADIFALYDETDQAVAFVMTRHGNHRTTFVFGGLDYGMRDAYDLYYNMMIQVLRVGFADQADIIDFGQTAERTKCRLGCELEPRYLLFLSSSRILNGLAKIIMPLIEYKPVRENHHVFK